MRLEVKKSNWPDELYKRLWVYRISIRDSITTTPFLLVYGTKAVIPTEFIVLTTRTQALDKMDEEQILLEQLLLVKGKGRCSSNYFGSLSPKNKKVFQCQGKEQIISRG